MRDAVESQKFCWECSCGTEEEGDTGGIKIAIWKLKDTNDGNMLWKTTYSRVRGPQMEDQNWGMVIVAILKVMSIDGGIKGLKMTVLIVKWNSGTLGAVQEWNMHA